MENNKLKRTQKDRGFGYKKALDYPDTNRDNKLIAEFMGMNIHHNDKSMMVKSTSQGNEVVPINALQYDTSWDWLMPVIEKIQDKHLENPELDYWGVDEIRLIEAIPNIQQVHYLVVNFIKENNDGKKQ